jgi:hypothetical protein
VSANHTRPVEDLHNSFVLFQPRAWNSLDSKLRRSGDVDTVQQILQSASRDWSFISGGLDFIGLTVHLVLFRITQGSVILVIFIFSLIAFFFSLIFVIIVIVVVFVVAIVLRQLLSFFRCFLSIFSRKYHDHDLKGILLLRNILRRVVLRLLLRWHISWCNQTDWLMSSALVGCAVRTNHLKVGNRRE